MSVVRERVKMPAPTVSDASKMLGAYVDWKHLVDDDENNVNQALVQYRAVLLDVSSKTMNATIIVIGELQPRKVNLEEIVLSYKPDAKPFYPQQNCVYYLPPVRKSKKMLRF